MLYAQESEQYHQVVASATTSVGLLPDYGRIDRELDIGLKRGLERLNQHFLFYTPPKMTRFIAMYYDWGLLYPDNPGIAPLPVLGDPVLLRIDLGGFEPDGTLRAEPVLGEPPRGRVIDLTNLEGGGLLFHDEIEVDWQPKPLLISIRGEQGPYTWSHQRSITVDLNLYRSAQGKLGLTTISEAGAAPVHNADRGQPGPAIPQTPSIPYIPADVSDGMLYLKVPAQCPVVVRNWLVNLINGTVFRIDSFEVLWDDDVPTGTRMRFNEPRFYL